MKRTILHEKHLGLNAKMVNFHGWEMPLHYGSQLQEHLTVRQECGIFDVSHMCVIELLGEFVLDFLSKLLSNNVCKLEDGQSQYSLMLTDDSQVGVIDDLIVLRVFSGRFFLVVNASRSHDDLEWIEEKARDFNIIVRERKDLAILAVQGPEARYHVDSCLLNSVEYLKPFQFLYDGFSVLSRTGYTGEDGFEIILPKEEVLDMWDRFLSSGVKPIGLGARDTLRLEAGLSLYGKDINIDTNPLEAGLKWTVAWKPVDRKFIGREALKKIWDKETSYKRVGLILQGRGVLRDKQKVICGGEMVGEISSGGYSPTLKKGIAFAKVKNSVELGSICEVESRGSLLKVQVVTLPFIRFGKPVFKIK